MQQYFVDRVLTIHDRVELNQEQSHHIQHVLRMRNGDVIRIANHKEDVFYAHVEFGQGNVVAILDEKVDLIQRNVSITLAQALIKGEKWDFLLQKTCELGVDRIVPFTCSRCVVKEKEDKKDKKHIRWNKIALEACEQCKRASLVSVEETIPFSKLIEFPHTLKIIAYEHADYKSCNLKDILHMYPNVDNILCVIGPEGGFDESEIAFLLEHGFQCVSLGTRILRAETAALSMVNNITFYYDN